MDPAFREFVTKNETRRGLEVDPMAIVSSRGPNFTPGLAPVLLSEKMRRFPRRQMILLHYLQMHTAGVFLVGIAVAAVIAIFAVSKQTSSLGEDIAISQPPRDDDAL